MMMVDNNCEKVDLGCVVLVKVGCVVLVEVSCVVLVKVG